MEASYRLPLPYPPLRICLSFCETLRLQGVVSAGACLVPPALLQRLAVGPGASVRVVLEDGPTVLAPVFAVPDSTAACLTASDRSERDDQCILLNHVPCHAHSVPDAPLARSGATISAIPVQNASFVEIEVPASHSEFQLSMVKRCLGRQSLVVREGASTFLRLPGAKTQCWCRIIATKPASRDLTINRSTLIVQRTQPRSFWRPPEDISTPLSRPNDELSAALGPALPRLVALLSISGQWRCRGILLHGPAGVGKTLLTTFAASVVKRPLMLVSGAEVSSSELRNAFESSSKLDRAILVIKSIDLIGGKRQDGAFASARLLAQLLTLMDGAESSGDCTVVGLTQHSSALDAALRRPGRLDREIEVVAPNVEQRASILRLYGVDASLSRRCVGFTGADIASLRDEARLLDDDFDAALKRVVASSRRSAIVRLRPAHWRDIGGLHDVKAKLRRVVEWPLIYADACKRLGVGVPRGVLLYGPPGCAKTTLARALAATTGESWSLFRLDPAMCYSAYVGEAERMVRNLFSMARANVPALVLLDEIDAIVGKRALNAGSDGDKVQERVLATLLNEMDGVQAAADVLVVAATNRPDMLDAALLRPGRFDHIFYVPPPDIEGRRAILDVHTRSMPLHEDVDLDELARRLERFTGAEIEGVCREAAIFALRDNRDASTVCCKDFLRALSFVKAATTDEMLEGYATFQRLMGTQH